jgi:hypothetical protein
MTARFILAYVVWVGWFLGANCATAQGLIDSVAEIPAAGFQDAFAYYDGTTGDVYLSIGESQTLLGIGGQI